MKKVNIKSPAKINFGLNIVNKREDGYHDIQTIFYPINLHDVMIFEKSDSFYFETDSEELNTTLKDNLIMKSVRSLEKVAHKKINVIINLEKYMPIGAGLGGGSSNAATTLISLNEILHLNVNNNKLRELGLKIGSDVPYFFKPKPSYAEGRGEKITQIKFKIDKPILLVNPNITISTKWAYSIIKPKEAGFSLKSLDKAKIENFAELKHKVVNDFEEPIFEKHPLLSEIKQKFYDLGAEFSLMSGSGSTIYGIFSDILAAQAAYNAFPKEYFKYINYEEELSFD